MSREKKAAWLARLGGRLGDSPAGYAAAWADPKFLTQVTNPQVVVIAS